MARVVPPPGAAWPVRAGAVPPLAEPFIVRDSRRDHGLPVAVPARPLEAVEEVTVFVADPAEVPGGATPFDIRGA